MTKLASLFFHCPHYTTTMAFSNVSTLERVLKNAVSVWMEAQNREKRMRFQTKTYLCGQGLKFRKTDLVKAAIVHFLLDKLCNRFLLIVTHWLVVLELKHSTLWMFYNVVISFPILGLGRPFQTLFNCSFTYSDSLNGLLFLLTWLGNIASINSNLFDYILFILLLCCFKNACGECMTKR